MKIWFWILICFWLCCGYTHAQEPLPVNEDTIYLNLEDAQKRLMEKNLTLLLNYYNIDIAKANYLQSKLLYNPNLTYWQELYNPNKRDFLNYSDEHGGQIQQLFTLAGRHKATWKLAEVGVKQAQYQVADILRNLKYELVTDMSDLYNNQALVKIYNTEESKLLHLIEITQNLYAKGNAAGEDVTRLQAQYRDAIAQELTSRQSIDNDEQDLKIILNYPPKTYFISLISIHDSATIPTFETVSDSAVKNRPDLLLAYSGSDYAEKNLKLQRTTGVPDLSLAANFESVNDYEPNFWGIQGSIDLPVFNRNQWNIAAAKEQLKQSEINDSLMLATVQNQVVTSYTNLLRYKKQMNEITPVYAQNLEDMMNNAFTNYEKRYISILDFLSELSTYLDGKTNLLNLQVQYFNAMHNLDMSTGTDLIK